MSLNLISIGFVMGAGVYSADTTIEVTVGTEVLTALTVPASTATTKAGLLTAFAAEADTAGYPAWVTGEQLILKVPNAVGGVSVTATITNADSVSVDARAYEADTVEAQASNEKYVYAAGGAALGYLFGRG